VRERGLCNGISPWLSPLAMVASQDIALRLFFRGIQVLGREHLPNAGPVLLAPTIGPDGMPFCCPMPPAAASPAGIAGSW